MSINFTIARHLYGADRTEGRILIPDHGLVLPTIERPWIPNPAGAGGLPFKSCIPDGYYKLVPHNSPDHPNTYALVAESLGVYHLALPRGLPFGRTACLIHTANVVSEVVGCIAPGLTRGTLKGAPAVLSSAAAMSRLRAILGRGENYVEIRPTAGTRELP
jgi:hypothetical protein